MLKPALWGTLLDRRLSFPLEVAQYNVATLTFSVPFSAARSLLPEPGFEPVEIGPGLAQFIITACDYRRTEWGPCRQICFAFLARPTGAGAGEAGLFVHRSPVDETFTCAVGRGVMSYPVSIELIEVEYTQDRVTFDLAVGVQPALRLCVPRTIAEGPAEQFSTLAYSLRDGVRFGMPVRTERPAAVVPDLRAVDITLGRGPLADELRGLGLPDALSSCTWGEDLTATFEAGRPV